jgi:hypothetical protein
MQKIVYTNKTYIKLTKNNCDVLFTKTFDFGASNLAMKTPDRKCERSEHFRYIKLLSGD